MAVKNTDNEILLFLCKFFLLFEKVICLTCVPCILSILCVFYSQH